MILERLLVASCITITACGPMVPVANLNKLSPEDAAKVRAVKVYNQAQLPALKFEVVGVVEGFSCQNKLWDASPTRNAAVEQAKYHAWEMGANGLANIQYGSSEGTSGGTNCWDLIRVSAEAIRVEAAENTTTSRE